MDATSGTGLPWGSSSYINNNNNNSPPDSPASSCSSQLTVDFYASQSGSPKKEFSTLEVEDVTSKVAELDDLAKNYIKTYGEFFHVPWQEIIPPTSDSQPPPDGDIFPFSIKVPPKERTESPLLGQISHHSFISLPTQLPQSKSFSLPYFYVVNIPFLATNDPDEDFRQIRRIIKIFETQAFMGSKDPDQDLRSRIAIVFGINKVHTLLGKENEKFNVLINKIEELRKSWKCAVNAFCFVWEPQWFQKQWNRSDKQFWEGNVSFEKVDQFVKKNLNNDLKGRIQREEDKFKRSCIPFGSIRGAIKDHPATTGLVNYFQTLEKQKIVYLCTIDSDVRKLQVKEDRGLFTAYDQFLLNMQNFPPPVILSGGFRISCIQDVLLQLQWDLANRVKTLVVSIFNDAATYFSEANTLILVPKKHYTLPESFGAGADEMKHLIQKIRERRFLGNKNEGPKVCFIPDAALTTTIPGRMDREYGAYMVAGKVRCWDASFLRQMRGVVRQALLSLDLAKPLRDVLPPLEYNSTTIYECKKELDEIHSLLSSIFTIYDPISYVLDLKETEASSFYENFQEACRHPALITLEKKDLILEKFEKLRFYYSQEILEKVELLAQRRAQLIGEFILEKFDFEDPKKDTLQEMGFTCMGKWIKRISQEQLDHIQKYALETKDSWEARQKELLRKVNGSQRTQKKEILTRLHIGLFDQHADLSKIASLIQEDLPSIDQNFSEKSIYPHPLSIVIENQDERSLALLLMAYNSPNMALIELKRVYRHLKNGSNKNVAKAEQCKVFECAFQVLSSSDFSTIDTEYLCKKMEAFKGLTPLHWALFFKSMSFWKEENMTALIACLKKQPQELLLFPDSKKNTKKLSEFIAELSGSESVDHWLTPWAFYKVDQLKITKVPSNPRFLVKLLDEGSYEENKRYLAQYPDEMLKRYSNTLPTLFLKYHSRFCIPICIDQSSRDLAVRLLMHEDIRSILFCCVLGLDDLDVSLIFDILRNFQERELNEVRLQKEVPSKLQRIFFTDKEIAIKIYHALNLPLSLKQVIDTIVSLPLSPKKLLEFPSFRSNWFEQMLPQLAASANQNPKLLEFVSASYHHLAKKAGYESDPSQGFDETSAPNFSIEKILNSPKPDPSKREHPNSSTSDKSRLQKKKRILGSDTENQARLSSKSNSNPSRKRALTSSGALSSLGKENVPFNAQLSSETVTGPIDHFVQRNPPEYNSDDALWD